MKNLKKWKENSDNRGFSFVLVIVAIGVVSLLIAVVLLVAYQNYQMKVTGLKSEDNFYSAEQVLDEIKAGLQGEMSSSVSEAYSYVLEHYTETEGSDETRNWYFQTQYVDRLYERLKKSGTSGEYDLANLGEYVIQGSPEEATAGVSTVAEDSENSGVTVEYKDGSKVELLCSVADTPVVYAEEGTLVKGEKPLQFSYEKGVTLQGLTVKYTNAKGYLSVVSTDLVLGIPEINFTQTTTTPDLLSYALISEGGIGVTDNMGGRTTITGNVYAGNIKIDNANLTVKAEDYLIVKDGITVESKASNTKELSKDKYHFVYEGSSLWTDHITLDSAAVKLDGDSYVRDDLTMNGNGSVASVAGRYYGYSNPELLRAETDNASTNSAIVVNGRNSVIDFSELSDLLLAGNAFIALDDSGYFTNDSEHAIRMGESIAIRSNQLAYLAPASAIRVANGTIVESGNPMVVQMDPGAKVSSLSVYLNTQVALKELGGKKLSNLGINANDCQKYVVQKENTNGTLTVYVYMDLDEVHAAAYFDAYYGKNLEEYAKIFLPDLTDDFGTTFHKNLSEMNRMEINGSAAAVTGSSLNQEGARQEVLGYDSAFKALCKKLILSYSALSDDEKSDKSTVFSNLVDKTNLENFVILKGGKAVFSTPATKMKALLIRGNYTVTSADADVRLIVATGDVTVSSDFTGLIVCEGKVTIKNGANITASPAETASVFQCIYDTSKTEVEYKEKTVSPMTFFTEGEQYLLNGIASGYVTETLGEQINLIDYIKFENWKKQ